MVRRAGRRVLCLLVEALRKNARPAFSLGGEASAPLVDWQLDAAVVDPRWRDKLPRTGRKGKKGHLPKLARAVADLAEECEREFPEHIRRALWAAYFQLGAEREVKRSDPERWKRNRDEEAAREEAEAIRRKEAARRAEARYGS